MHKEKEERLELKATGQKTKEDRRQLQEPEEEETSLAWLENPETQQEITKSWVEDLEEWQQTLGAGEDPLRKGTIFACLLLVIITVMVILLFIYIRDVE